MKNERQEKILELIRRYPIDRQETMMEHLSQEGFSVTQATVSRDIRQLHLVKVSDGQGGYRYMAQDAGNVVLVKCYSGMANAACELFDAMSWENVVGTLSGDDTFFVLMRSEAAADSIVGQLRQYMAQR